MRRQFYLHPRKSVWYCELVDPKTGQKLSARSTKCRDRDSAVAVAARWLVEGVPSKHTPGRSVETLFTLDSILDGIRKIDDLSPNDAEKIAEALKRRGLLVSYAVPGGRGSQFLTDFLLKFWDYEDSAYVKEKRAHGQSITRGHCQKCLERVRKYWKPYFEGKRLAELTRADLKAFGLWLASSEKALAAATINRVMVLGKSALRWAYENDYLAEDVVSGVATFSGASKRRGVLEPDEVTELFAEGKWTDQRIKLANVVACTTGLRQGEILALRPEDVGEVVLHVRHSWSETDGLKAPKTGEERRAPLLPEVRKALLAQAAMNPHDPDGWIFWTPDTADHPMTARPILDGLKAALGSIGIDHRGRAICFHSWRHYFSARMNDRIDAKKVMRATGHATLAVFEGYADHALESDLAEIREIASEIFANVIPFNRAANG